MQHDQTLRAAAHAIYDSCFPTEEVAPVGFEEAERYGTIHYRRVVEAAKGEGPIALRTRGPAYTILTKGSTHQSPSCEPNRAPIAARLETTQSQPSRCCWRRLKSEASI